MIAKLCVGGDWACAHGDFAALGDIADRLAGYARETLHCELETLAALCKCDPEQAVAMWMKLKEQVREVSEHRP